MSEPRKKRGLSIADIKRDASFGGQYQPVPTYEKPARPDSPAPQPARPEQEAPAKSIESPEPAKAPEMPDKAPAGPKPEKTPEADKGAVRNVSFNLYPKTSHKADLDALAGGKITITDILRVAGRNAMADFEPDANFVETKDVERLGAAYRYRTSKNIKINVLKKLHAENNPLSLHSDFTMIRGQIEPVFWSKLDELIKKLKTQKKV